jgi:Fe-S cluster biogenesis protein NfuA
MAEPDGAARPRLNDAAVRERLGRLDELLAQVEQIPGPAGELALEAVSALAEIYGEALTRAVGYVADHPAALEPILTDELLAHLLVLHGAHPEPVERRVTRALDELRPALEQHGAQAELSGIDQGVATVRMAVSGCGSSASGIQDAVRDAVLAVAPELHEVRPAPAEPRPAAFVPVDILMHRPSSSPVG